MTDNKNANKSLNKWITLIEDLAEENTGSMDLVEFSESVNKKVQKSVEDHEKVEQLNENEKSHEPDERITNQIQELIAQIEKDDSEKTLDNEDISHEKVAHEKIVLDDSSLDELTWKAIENSIKNHPELKVKNVNVVTTIINNIYKSINSENDISTIKPDSAFAILHEQGSVLPEGAIGWFLSEEQIENLSLQISLAVDANNSGLELLGLQKTFVNLGANSELVEKTIQDVSSNYSLLAEILDLANSN